MRESPVRWSRTACISALAILCALPVPISASESASSRAADAAADPIGTCRLMLSGSGPDDAIPWDFTLDGGRRSGERASLPVPSNWQQHGFGSYQYGNDDPDDVRSRGTYRRSFVVPPQWRGRTIRLVFDGVMTDARVIVNGTPAGPIHRGGFYRFGFDVTRLLKVGRPNVVEVEVSEDSADPDTNAAERFSDYWVFGGIFRPVWLEATPTQAISHAAIDARASGDLTVDVTLAAPREVTRIEGQVRDADGRTVGAPFSTPIPAGGAGRVRLATRLADPKLWSAETPNLHELTLTLYQGAVPVHRTHERFGFRTFEIRPGTGLYLNGRRILLKGVNRHSFRPDTARALTRKDNYDDVRLIRSMNMNAVRMSHYPPDESFLQAADELGLYVLDELSGWQHAHSTEIGRRLVREMVERDVNHPSVVLWDNGNEGGWNRELDGDFALHDPQGRKVLHPWELHDGIDTIHYPPYPALVRKLAGPNLVMPTEFLHALFDGGAGAGLEDYWRAISGSSKGAGGFIWAFADEGVARTDQGGAIDAYGVYAPDGILSARHEKEASYRTVRDVWSPVQIATPTLDSAFTGSLQVANGYDFTSTDAVRFDWQLLRFAKPRDAATAPRILHQMEARASIAPGHTGELRLALPPDWRNADALQVRATQGAEELWTWVWPVRSGAAGQNPRGHPPAGNPHVALDATTIRLAAGRTSAVFDSKTGLLRGVTRDGRAMGLANGPRLVAIAAGSKDEPVWTSTAGDGHTFRPVVPTIATVVEVKLDGDTEAGWTGFTLEVSPDGGTWKTISTGKRAKLDAGRYPVAPGPVAAIRISELRTSRGKPPAVLSVRLGNVAERLPRTSAAAVRIESGTSNDAANGSRRAWLEARGAGGLDRTRWTMAADGVLTLEYSYRLEGEHLYHGIGFDFPLERVTGLRGLVEGPGPVWQNRLRGTSLGVHMLAASNDPDLPLPTRAGYFAGLRWASFASPLGDWTVESAYPATFLRIGTRLDDHPDTTVEFPAGDIGFLAVIPAMGSKFIRPDQSGPAGQPASAHGAYSGRLTFSW